MKRVSSGDWTVLCACSICGIAAEYPTELRYDSDGLFVCFRHAQTENALDESRARQSVRIQDETTLPGPLGPKPGYMP